MVWTADQDRERRRAMTPPLRWRVDCRKQRGPWKTVQYEPYDLLCEALTARLTHLLTEDWDSIEVVPIAGTRGEGRALLAKGGRLRADL
jgi:hypothetical protein